MARVLKGFVFHFKEEGTDNAGQPREIIHEHHYAAGDEVKAEHADHPWIADPSFADGHVESPKQKAEREAAAAAKRETDELARAEAKAKADEIAAAAKAAEQKAADEAAAAKAAAEKKAADEAAAAAAKGKK